MRSLLLCLLFLATTSTAVNITTIPPQSEFDSSHAYFIALLALALDETKDSHGAFSIAYSKQFEQGRAIQDLKNNHDINVYWAGTSIEREQDLQAVPIPLVKGMLGMRLFAIQKNKAYEFAKVASLQDLSPLSACQGTHWPDSDIMEAAGINVRRVAQYELMWGMLERSRCDYFPRGVHEIYSEIEARKMAYEDLEIYPYTGLYYPFPMYFFTSKENAELASRIAQGLEKAIDNGRFEALMREHPATQHLYPLEQWQDVNWIPISNSTLPDSANPTNPRYWYQPSR